MLAGEVWLRLLGRRLGDVAHPMKREDGPMSTALLAASFLFLWAGTTLLLSRLPQFQRRPSLAERLRPYVTNDRRWITEVETWLSQH